jgi:cobaltochelatase CobS
MSNNKITCAICGKWSGHVIVGHLKEAHPKVDLFDYMQEHDAPMASPLGFKHIEAARASLPVVREREARNIATLFDLPPEKDETANRDRRFVNRTVSCFAESNSFVPDVDANYQFPEQPLKKLLMALALPERNRVWLHGYSGTGKTQLVTQVCARMNYGLIRINADSAISRRQLVGDWVVRGGETVFQYGVMVEAMRRGYVFLIDEIDHFAPPTLATLRGVLEDPSQLIILENGGEVVKAHPDFRVVATANTAGAGDESGLFVTSRALSLADRQRFSVWVKVDYLPPAAEAAMLLKRFPRLKKVELQRFHQVVRAIREGHVRGEFEESFSPRELINWVEKFFLVGDAAAAAEMCFLDRYQSPAVQSAVSELVRAAFDQTKPPTDIPGLEDV